MEKYRWCKTFSRLFTVTHSLLLEYNDLPLKMYSIFIRNAFILTNVLFLGTVFTVLLVSQIFFFETNNHVSSSESVKLVHQAMIRL